MSIEFENKPLEWGVEGVEPSEEKKAQGFANSEAPAAGHWDYKFRSDFLVQKELQEKVSELSEQGIDTSKLVTEEEFMSHKADEVKHITSAEREKWNDIFSTYKTGKDNTKTFQMVEKKRSDGTLFAKSVFSNPNADGNYLVRTYTEYASDGTTVVKTVVFDLIYDIDGDWINEVKRA